MAKRGRKKSIMEHTKGRKGGRSTMMVGAAGAVVGAAIGAAGAMAMQSPTFRKKIGATMSDLREYAASTLEEYNHRVEPLYHQTKDKITDGKRMVTKVNKKIKKMKN